MTNTRSKRVKREREDDAQLPSDTAAAQASPKLPTHILESLGLAASDLENPSKETFNKIVSQLKETSGLLETARGRLAQHGDREPLTMPSARKSHCVRCHTAYDEAQNTNKACVIQHWGDLDRVSKHSFGSTWEWDGCGCRNESESHDDFQDDGPCYQGRHATNPKEVEYVKDKGAAKPKREYTEDDGVRTCRQRGCKR